MKRKKKKLQSKIEDIKLEMDECYLSDYPIINTMIPNYTLAIPKEKSASGDEILKIDNNQINFQDKNWKSNMTLSVAFNECEKIANLYSTYLCKESDLKDISKKELKVEKKDHECYVQVLNPNPICIIVAMTVESEILDKINENNNTNKELNILHINKGTEIKAYKFPLETIILGEKAVEEFISAPNFMVLKNMKDKKATKFDDVPFFSKLEKNRDEKRKEKIKEKRKRTKDELSVKKQKMEEEIKKIEKWTIEKKIEEETKNIEILKVYVKIEQDEERDLPALKEKTFVELKKLIQNKYEDEHQGKIKKGEFKVFDEDGKPVSEDDSVQDLRHKSTLQIKLNK